MGGRNEEKARQALEAMRKLGFGRKQATPVLKRLFRLFDRQWQPIEDDSYRALVEAILDDQPPQSQQESPQSPQSQPQPNAAGGGGPANEASAPPSGSTTPTPTPGSGGQSRCIMMDAEFQHPAFFPRDPKPEPVDMDASACRDVQPGLILRSRNPNRNALPPTDTNPHHISGDKNRAAVSQQEPTTSSTLINGTGSQVQEIDVASSPGGEVKLSLKCTAHPSNLNVPPHNMQAVYKILEDKYLSSDKLLPPDFSIPGLLAEVCQSVVQLGTQHFTVEHTTQSHTLGNASTSKGMETLGNASTSKGVETLGNASTSKGAETLGNATTSKGVETLGNATTSKGVETLGNATTSKGVETLGNATTSKGVETLGNATTSKGVETSTPAPQQHSRTTHDVHDISKGEEHVKIPIANESGRGKCPPSFSYIPGNQVFQNAIVNISLAQIGAQDCCADCFGDCLSAPVPCACARVTGGEYAYTPGGLVKPEFIDKCVSMNRFPEAHHKVFCKTCPLERSRDKASPEPCRGHLVRKFIKECWSKCGCSMRCGNRVVQRGIRFNLQVFPTGNGRGWGLRTQNALPKGAFVCEYVGEILTCAEVHERAVENMKNARYTHTVALDAGWPSGGSLKDEDALCLDGTFYGNVGRFINHRCRDANLAMVPVQVETPDRHYYHVAFFTSRKVEALEELTWDYGIDFEEESERGPVKVFECLCGSKYCRGSRHLRNGNGNGKKRSRD